MRRVDGGGGGVFALSGPVSVFCDWVRKQV